MSECDLDPGPLSNSSPPMSVTAQHGEPHQMHDKLFSVGRLQHMAAHGKRGPANDVNARKCQEPCQSV